jgi:hypothetical protein
MNDAARMLFDPVGGNVVNGGPSGRYDLTLDCSDGEQGKSQIAIPAGPSVDAMPVNTWLSTLSGFREQSGLKLEAQKLPAALGITGQVVKPARIDIHRGVSL